MKRILIQLDENIYEDLRKQAYLTHLSLSELIRQAINYYLKEQLPCTKEK